MKTGFRLGDALDKLHKQFPGQLLIIRSKAELDSATYSEATNYNQMNGKSHFFKNNDIQIVEVIEKALAAGRQASIMNTMNDNVLVCIAEPGKILFGPKKSSSCFVATAVYGSPLASEVLVFSRFRDEVLLKSRFGTAFTKTYYVASPPFAQLISKFSFLRGVTRRFVLGPLLKLVKRYFNSTHLRRT